jgi:tocopherol O-methyltransferase
MPVNAREHYSALQQFYERLTGDLSIHLPLSLPGTASLEDAHANAAKLMARTARISAGQRVLDAGCGLGGTAFWLRENYSADVFGVTNSVANMHECRRLATVRRMNELMYFIAADLMALPFAPHTFDCVWNLESLNYLSPKQAYIQDVWRVLKPAGTWVCMDRFGDSTSWDRPASRRSAHVLAGGLYTARHWESAATLQDYMRIAGFIDITYTDLTACVLPGPGRRRVSASAAASAVLSTLRNPAAFRAMLRAARIIRASFDLMERGGMTYGLLSGRKPPADHSRANSPPAR